MIEIPVVWLSLHKDTPPFGYWDQTMLRDALDGRLGTTPVTFHHYAIHAEPPADATEWPIADGVVVVIPARSHVDRVNVIKTRLELYAWTVVILTGDEEETFPWQELVHIYGGERPDVVVMRQTPKLTDGRPLPTDHYWFGDGYTPGFRDALATDTGFGQYLAKAQDFVFAGQVTHQRRKECVAALASLRNGSILPTEGFTQGVKPESYALLMASAKIAPCPSGPVSVDTFRAFEAFEAGCVPLLDGRSPLYSQFRYWDDVLGRVPCPVIDDWRTVPHLIKTLLDDWPANANRCFAWWQMYKRHFAVGIVDAVEEAMGGTFSMPIERSITALITSSPVPSYDAHAMLQETIGSIRERLPYADIIVAFDGVRPEQEHLRERYEMYQRIALWSMNHLWEQVYPVRVDDWHHQAMLTRHALEAVESPLVLFVEHDTPLTGDIPFNGLAGVVMGGEANLVRFYHEAAIHPEHEHLMIHMEPNTFDGIPLVGTMQWSQRPHLARTDWYIDMLDTHFGSKSKTMIEDTMHGVLDHDYRHDGVYAWNRWKTYLYAPDGDMKRSTHLDGRGDEPKYDMIYEYDGEIPPGAPYPTSQRVD